MPQLDTQYEDTNRELLNRTSYALTTADEYTSKLLDGMGPTELQDKDYSIDPPKPPDMAKPDINDITQDLDTKDPAANLTKRLEEWKDQFFPTLSEGFNTIPDEWLMNVLNGTYPLGMRDAVFRKVWQRTRDREESQRRSSLREASVELSQRGFSVPPGAYVAAVDRARRESDRAVQEINVEQALRDEEIKINMIQFAADRAIQLRQGLTSTVAGYLRTWASVESDDTLEKARIRAQAQSTFYSALQSYYNVESTFEELRFRAQELEHNADLQHEQNKVDLRTRDQSKPALAQAIQGLSDIAASTSSAAGTLLAQIEGV